MNPPLNLARRPFLNTRPVVRITASLWVVGALLTVVVAWLYWSALYGIEDRRGQAAELSRQIATEERQAEAARQALRTLDLREQNQRASFLNQRIGERTFPWSRLFDDLAEVLPDRVRLLSLSPRSGEQRERFAGRRRAVEMADDRVDRVRLEVRAVAEKDEGVLDLLDNLFASSLFERPALPRESRQNDGSLQFQLTVEYLTQPRVVAEAFLAEVLPEGTEPEWEVADSAADPGARRAPEASQADATGLRRPPSLGETGEPAARRQEGGEVARVAPGPGSRSADRGSAGERPATSTLAERRPPAAGAGRSQREGATGASPVERQSARNRAPVPLQPRASAAPVPQRIQ